MLQYNSKKITPAKTPFGTIITQLRLQAEQSPQVQESIPVPQEAMSSFLFKGLKQKWLSQGPAVNRTDEKTTYKMHLRLFEEGSPQQWLALMHDIKIVWTQNGLSKPSDRIACLHAILMGESKTAFEAALVELAVDEDGHMDMKNEHVELALKEVGKEVFPRRALELQRLWMLRYMQKPKHLSIRKTINAITKMNNSLPLLDLP